MSTGKIRATIQRVISGQTALKPLKDGYIISTYQSNGILIGDNQPDTRPVFVSDEIVNKILKHNEPTELIEVDQWSE